MKQLIIHGKGWESARTGNGSKFYAAAQCIPVLEWKSYMKSFIFFPVPFFQTQWFH